MKDEVEAKIAAINAKLKAGELYHSEVNYLLGEKRALQDVLDILVM